MTRDQWQTEFARQLNQKLGISPEQVHFCWKQYYNQRYSVENAIADLEQKHQLYPMLEILPKQLQGTKVQLIAGCLRMPS